MNVFTYICVVYMAEMYDMILYIFFSVSLFVDIFKLKHMFIFIYYDFLVYSTTLSLHFSINHLYQIVLILS